MNGRKLYRTKSIPAYVPAIGLVLALCFCMLGKPLGAATPPAPSAAPTGTSPTAAAAASPGAGLAPTYDGGTQSRYIATANTAFVTERTAKFQAFVDARTAFETAGGVDPKGFTSKAAVIERRNLLGPVIKANEDYLAFMTMEESIYRAELAKTGLVPTDVDAVATEFALKANIPRAVKVQESEKDLLSDADQMLGDLETGYGGWSLTKTQKLTFKKKSLLGSYSALENKYNTTVDQMRQLQQPAASPSPAAAPPSTPTVTTP